MTRWLMAGLALELVAAAGLVWVAAALWSTMRSWRLCGVKMPYTLDGGQRCERLAGHAGVHAGGVLYWRADD